MNIFIDPLPSRPLRWLLLLAAMVPVAAQSPTIVTLPHHIPSGLENATRLPHTSRIEGDQLTVTVVLKLSDEAGRDALVASQNDPGSPNYRKIIGIDEFTARFGPSQEAYDSVLAYLGANGLTLTKGSSNRRTLTVTGTRAQIEQAFHVNIDDYQLVDRTFHAIASDPAMPAALAPLVSSVAGLSNMAEWKPAGGPSPPKGSSIATAYNAGSLPPGIDGTGQVIGLIEFANFNASDVADWLKWAGMPSSQINHLFTYAIDPASPCTPSNPGDCSDSVEVLLDIDAAMSVAPGADIIVYLASGLDYASVFNSAAGDLARNHAGRGTLSLSWNQCEGVGVSSSDATSMDSLVADYVPLGITLFVASGDNGSTCEPGGITTHSNTISFPADAPHAVAVGGTVLSVESGNTYYAEQWWGYDDPVGGAGGGFGVSQFFGEPSYQVAYYADAPGRSVPDVSAESEPGVIVCQASTSKPTNCFGVGGTSLAAPLWAAMWALTGQVSVHSSGSTISAGGSFLYNMPGTFHTAASMVGPDNDFMHVGLGSPDITAVAAKTNPPRVDGFSPDSGSAGGGTTVTITGAGFVGVEKVTFGGIEATNITVLSDTKLTVQAPAAQYSEVNVEVVTRGGSAVASDVFFYLPQITGVSPNVGPMQGEIVVTVTGTFTKGFTFTFGGTPATSVSCTSTQCTMVAPAHAPGTVSVVAQSSSGEGNSTLKNAFTYQGVSIISFSPVQGPTTGGAIITIYGSSLTNATTVSFGGTVVGGLTCSSGGTGCYVTTPAHAVGPVHLTATANGVTSSPTSATYTFLTFPTITSISPSSGTNGTVVTITGTGFGTAPGTTFISFAGAAACRSTTVCTATMPKQEFEQTTEMQVEVTVDGLTSQPIGFLYYLSSAPPPPGCKGNQCMVATPRSPVH